MFFKNKTCAPPPSTLADAQVSDVVVRIWFNGSLFIERSPGRELSGLWPACSVIRLTAIVPDESLGRKVTAVETCPLPPSHFHRCLPPSSPLPVSGGLLCSPPHSPRCSLVPRLPLSAVRRELEPLADRHFSGFQKQDLHSSALHPR